MAVKNFGGNNNSSVNYSIRTLDSGNRIFVTECDPTDKDAIKFTRQKDGTNFKAGDDFYAKGGNVVSGVLKGVWVHNGYNSDVAKDLAIGLASTDASGKVVTEFVKLPLMNDKGRLDNATVRVLAALNKADLGEEIDLAIHTFKHKAGDKITNAAGEDTGKVWEKDGVNIVMSVYQPHLVTNDNKNGRIAIPKDEHYTQPTFYVDKSKVIQITPGVTKVKEGAIVQYDTEDATAFYDSLVKSIVSKVGDASKLAPPAASPDDMQFGDDQSDNAGFNTRIGSRP